jgi:hypothetical protein
MTLVLPTIYHWSPASRYVDIKRDGLKVYSDTSVSTEGSRWPYICFSFDPMTAWSLSSQTLIERELTDDDEWDLWALRQIPEDAAVHVNPSWGGEMKEVRVLSSIEPSALWHCGRKGNQEVGINAAGEALTGADFGLGESQKIECPDQETIDTLLALIRTGPRTMVSDGQGRYVDFPRILDAAQKIIDLIPNPEQEQ